VLELDFVMDMEIIVDVGFLITFEVARDFFGVEDQMMICFGSLER